MRNRETEKKREEALSKALIRVLGQNPVMTGYIFWVECRLKAPLEDEFFRSLSRWCPRNVLLFSLTFVPIQVG